MFDRGRQGVRRQGVHVLVNGDDDGEEAGENECVSAGLVCAGACWWQRYHARKRPRWDRGARLGVCVCG